MFFAGKHMRSIYQNKSSSKYYLNRPRNVLQDGEFCFEIVYPTRIAGLLMCYAYLDEFWRLDMAPKPAHGVHINSRKPAHEANIIRKKYSPHIVIIRVMCIWYNQPYVAILRQEMIVTAIR